MRPRPLLLGLGLATLAQPLVDAAEAQLVPEPPITQMDWKVRTVRDSGQPVLPIFEGWYATPDGAYRLCFGFFNLNRAEALDIPLGPDNYIEPPRFDGSQPTHFPALGPSDGSGTIRREYCTFTVAVPSDIGSERVWWNLRIDGHVYRVPGHITSRPYMVDDLVNSVGAAMELFDENTGYTGTRVAPLVRVRLPSGTVEGRGKSGFHAGPVAARVGAPLRLAVEVSLPGDVASAVSPGPLATQRLRWMKFRGPAGGGVTFQPAEGRFEVGTTPHEHETSVSFARPGDYVLLLQALNGSYADQCCWTNAYVRVQVTE